VEVALVVVIMSKRKQTRILWGTSTSVKAISDNTLRYDYLSKYLGQDRRGGVTLY
jgi:hypothetical protein